MAAQQSVLQPGVAGRFYPGDPETLSRDLQGYLSAASRPADMTAKAIIAPHAGYIYSGAIAASAYKLLEGQEIDRVVLLGPSHHAGFRGVALPDVQAMRTPLGDIKLDRDSMIRLQQEPDVDWFTDAFRPEHSLDVQLPFLRHILGDSFILLPMLVGDVTPDRLDTLLEMVWGGDETLVVISSDLSHFHSYEDAEKIDSASCQAIETLNSGMLQGGNACGCRAVNGLLARARRLDMRATTLDRRNSGDTAGSKDKVVGYGAWAFEYARTAKLPENERQMLRDAAATTIRHGVVHGKPPGIDLNSFPPRLRTRRASFVTITIAGQLRGCIGSVEAHAPLLTDVVSSAFKAAFSDPRFRPLSEAELRQIEVKVSILGAFRPIAADSPDILLGNLEPDRDGLIITGDGKRALFLPSVWESLPEPQRFLSSLMQKAGMRPDVWPRDMQAFRFTTESF